MSENLEKITETKKEITPEVQKAMESMLGVNVKQINEDISNRLVEGNLDFDIDLGKGFKQSKEEFKKTFLARLLGHTNGNITEAARIADLDRRTIHRLIKKHHINIENARQMPYQFLEDKKKEYVKDVINEILDKYDITRGKYEADPSTTQKISEKLPYFRLTFDQAIDLFEREFIKKALETYKSQKEAAKKIGLRYETLHRKAKEFNLLG
jgi:DNA-binding NtrC family response regulator